MKRLIFSALVLSAVTANAQVKDGMVGINTDEPRATMHIEPGVSESKGLIIPRITAAQMKTMTNLAHFGADHHAIITYLKEQLPAADRTGKLVDVADPGYYYYDNTTGVQKWKTFGGGAEQDFKALPTSTPGLYNYLTKGGGIGGTSLGTGYNNIGIGGGGTFNFLNNSDMTGSWNTAIGHGVFQLSSGGGGTMSSQSNIGIGTVLYTFQNGGSMTGGVNIGMGNGIYKFQKTNAQFSGYNNTGIGQNLFNLTNGNLTGGNNIGMGNGLYKLDSGNMVGSSNIGIGNDSYYVVNGDMTPGAYYNIALGNNIYRLTNSSTSTFSGYNNIGIGSSLYNIASGNLAGYNNIGIGDGSYNLSGGDMTSSAYRNIALGASVFALGNAGSPKFSGNDNIGIGTNAFKIGWGGSGNAVLTGSYNMGMGFAALGSNVGGLTGNYNIAFGYQTMYSNWGDVSGSNNIALGHNALYSNWNGYTGSNNIGIGENALYNGSGNTGDMNIAIGYYAGYTLANGNGNVFLGNSFLGSDTAGLFDNVVAIGHGISPSSSTPDNVILLGSNDNSNPTKIGVGTYNPQAKLDVNGGVRVGEDNNPCTYDNRGTIRFDNGTYKFQGCDGSNWVNLN